MFVVIHHRRVFVLVRGFEPYQDLARRRVSVFFFKQEPNRDIEK